MKPFIWTCLCWIGMTTGVVAQVTRPDSAYSDLETVVISFNQWEAKRNEVPNRILKVDLRDNILRNPQTAADMLGQSAHVFIQKSQQSGGSPMLRGFGTNRLLLAVDGVRMNTAIFRAGNLQQVIVIDPFVIEKAEICFGPGSVMYGSDAIGGVISFNTIQPQLNADGFKTSANVSTRLSSANNEFTYHGRINLGSKKFASLTAYSTHQFGDLKMGKKQNGNNPFFGERPFYVETINGQDQLVANDNRYVQKFTAYKQYDFMQKFAFKEENGNQHSLNFQFRKNKLAIS